MKNKTNEDRAMLNNIRREECDCERIRAYKLQDVSPFH